MSTVVPPPTPPAPSTAMERHPIARRLLVGAVAACVDAGISAGNLAVFGLADPPADAGPLARRLPEIVDLCTIIPEILVLVALLTVARGVGSVALWRSSIGVFGCIWLLLMAMIADGRAWWNVAAFIIVLIGILVVGKAVFQRPWEAVQPVAPAEPSPASGQDATQSGPAPAAPPVLEYQQPPKKAFDWSWIVFAGVYILLRQVFRALGLNLESAVVIVSLFLLLAAMGFLLWFGIVKIDLAPRLGRVCAICGGMELLMVGTAVGTMVWVLYLGISGAMPEFTMEDARVFVPFFALELQHVAWKVILAALLFTLWLRAGRAADVATIKAV